MCGEFVAALEHFDHAIALYDPKQQHEMAFPLVYSQNMGAWALLALGYPEQAQKRKDEALATARKLLPPFGQVYALFHAAVFHLYRQEALVAQLLSEEAIPLAADLEFSMMLAWVMITWGWALAEQDKGEEGLTQMSQGLATLQATGAELSRPTWLGAMAKACGKSRTSRRGTASPHRGIGDGKQNRRVSPASGIVSAQRRTHASKAVESHKSQVKSPYPLAPNT